MKTKMNKMELLPILLSIVNLIVSVIFITHLPDVVPTHFGIDWVCDSVGSPWAGVIMPIFQLVIVTSAPAVERLVTEHPEKNRRVTQITILMICMFFMAMGWLILMTMGSGVRLGEQADAPAIGWLVSLCCAFLFIGQGNYLPIVQQNKTLGIKIKYTLENEACWKVTHRFTGKLWVATGIVYLLMILLAMLLRAPQLLALILLVAVMMVNMVIPCVYAYQHRDEA